MTWPDVKQQLSVWLSGIPDLEAEGYISPSKIALDKALESARKSEERGDSGPTRICPDGEGGVEFEWFDGATILKSENFSQGEVKP